MSTRVTPESLLRGLGVIRPEDIDLEAIAWSLGARVRYRPLNGCEARIVGNGSTAIVTVNSSSPAGRQRFSLAHEIGHWVHHRGRRLICRATEIDGAASRRPPEERTADFFASNLILPTFLVSGAVGGESRLTFQVVTKIAGIFRTSATAAAIRLVEMGRFPALLVCHTRAGRKWFTRSPLVPERWFPKEELDASSGALEALFGTVGAVRPSRRVTAAAWFEIREASGATVTEQALRVVDGEVLSLIVVDDKRMLT